jgi:hypothetical protein
MHHTSQNSSKVQPITFSSPKLTTFTRHQWLTCNPSYSGGWDQEDHTESQPGQIVGQDLPQKYSTWATWVAKVVECLPSKREAWSSSSSTAKTKQKN